MNSLLSPRFSWREPEAFRLNEDGRSVVNSKWWLRPLCLFVFVAMLMFSWGLAKLTPDKHLPDFVVVFPMIVGVGFILFYLYLWWLRRCPTSISLYSRGIIRMGESSIRSFKTISGYNWSEEDSCFVLRLMTPKGRTILYGIPDRMTLEKIEIILNQAGLTKISTPIKPDFAVRRKAIWGERVFTAAEVEAMREDEMSKGKQ